MPRALTMVERVVTEADRNVYISEIAARRERMSNANANFWVFEKVGYTNEFLEFVEAGSTHELAIAIDVFISSSEASVMRSTVPVWREVSGV